MSPPPKRHIAAAVLLVLIGTARIVSTYSVFNWMLVHAGIHPMSTIEDWFEGFRHGAAVARDGGYRKFVTGPSSLQMPPPATRP